MNTRTLREVVVYAWRQLEAVAAAETIRNDAQASPEARLGATQAADRAAYECRRLIAEVRSLHMAEVLDASR